MPRFPILIDPSGSSGLRGWRWRLAARAELEIAVPLERLATRDGSSHAWRPPSGEHTLSVGHVAGNHDGGTFVVDLP